MLLKPLILDFSNIQYLFEPGFLRLLAAKKPHTQQLTITRLQAP